MDETVRIGFGLDEMVRIGFEWMKSVKDKVGLDKDSQNRVRVCISRFPNRLDSIFMTSHSSISK